MPRAVTLRSLLAPVPVRRFLAEDWGEQPLYIRGAHSKHARIFGWRELNHALATQRLEPPRLRLALQGEGSATLDSFLKVRTTADGRRVPKLDVRALNQLLARGATLVLNSIQDMHPPLAALARDFAQLFLVEPNINLYASFGRQPGFGPHWDNHDVFVLQIAGRKRWLLYGPSRRYPLFRDARRNDMQPLRVRARYRLEAGDVLYIPRGHWHDAIGVGEPTLHLTLGVPTLTGPDFLAWLADDTRAVESARRNIPVADAKRRKQWMEQLNRTVNERLDTATLARYLDERRAGLDASTQPAFPHGVRAPSMPARSDLLRWTGSAHATTAITRAGLHVRTMDREFVFDTAAAPLVERLLTGETIGYGALQRSFARKLGPARLRRFISELLREHFITIVPSE